MCVGVSVVFKVVVEGVVASVEMSAIVVDICGACEVRVIVGCVVSVALRVLLLLFAAAAAAVI